MGLKEDNCGTQSRCVWHAAAGSDACSLLLKVLHTPADPEADDLRI